MSKSFPPAKMRAWQFTTTGRPIEANLHLNSVPLPTPTPTQNLVQVLAVALNPVDYKPAEIPLLSSIIIPSPSTPGLDFAGRIIVPSPTSNFKRGDFVFGISGKGTPINGGGLREYSVCETKNVVAVPEGVDILHAATVGVAGLSALQSIGPHIKKGDSIFINGGSGGTGVFGIQIAKAMGCYVTTTCSGVNIDLCKSLGADQVVDYRKGNVVEELKSKGVLFDRIIDNVGGGDLELYWRAHEYTKAEAVYVMVGGGLNLQHFKGTLKSKIIPAVLGGGKRKKIGFFPKTNSEDLARIAEWMKDGKVKSIVDEKFPFEQAPEAFAKLRTGRAKGKIVVDVALETYQKAWEA